MGLGHSGDGGSLGEEPSAGGSGEDVISKGSSREGSGCVVLSLDVDVDVQSLFLDLNNPTRDELLISFQAPLVGGEEAFGGDLLLLLPLLADGLLAGIGRGEDKIFSETLRDFTCNLLFAAGGAVAPEWPAVLTRLGPGAHFRARDHGFSALTGDGP